MRYAVQSNGNFDSSDLCILNSAVPGSKKLIWKAEWIEEVAKRRTISYILG